MNDGIESLRLATERATCMGVALALLTQADLMACTQIAMMVADSSASRATRIVLASMILDGAREGVPVDGPTTDDTAKLVRALLDALEERRRRAA